MIWKKNKKYLKQEVLCPAFLKNGFIFCSSIEKGDAAVLLLFKIFMFLIDKIINLCYNKL